MGIKINKLNVANTNYELEDIRISSGSTLPTGQDGDIFLTPNDPTEGAYTTSGNWIYFTRSDGMTEAIGSFTFSVSTHFWASESYITYGVISDANRTYPVTFQNPPVVTFGLDSYNNSSGWMFWLATNEAKPGTTTRCPDVYGVRLNSAATVGGHIWIRAIGVVA